jgi:hypothetical protein
MRISVFAPGTQDVNSVFSQGSLTLKSESYEESPTFEVIATGVHLKGVSAPAFPRKASGTTINLLHLAKLTINEIISANQTAIDPKSEEPLTSLLFRLSNLKYATPDASVGPDYLGNRKVNINKTYVVKCSNNNVCDGELKLEKHYSPWHKYGSNKEIVCAQGVFAWQGNNSTNVADIPFLLNLADDVCLLLTFAARHRVMVLGYDYSTPYRRFKHFRNPLAPNRIRREETGRDELVPLAEFEAFMQTAITSWGNLSEEGKESIRLAIVALHPLTEPSPERDYMAMFAALEGLSYIYKDKVIPGLEKGAWKSIKNTLSEWIDNQTSISPEAKDLLKNNLSELKKAMTLEVRMKGFLKSNKVNVDDLWPIFEKDKLCGLYWVRNKLAHGRHFSDERFGAFLKAKEHLSLVLERVVLRMLGFDPHRTTAGIQTLFNQRRRLSKDQLEELQKGIMLKT